jgi:hypothetical protein
MAVSASAAAAVGVTAAIVGGPPSIETGGNVIFDERAFEIAFDDVCMCVLLKSKERQNGAQGRLYLSFRLLKRKLVRNPPTGFEKAPTAPILTKNMIKVNILADIPRQRGCRDELMGDQSGWFLNNY